MRCDNAVATFGVAFLVKCVAFWVKDTVAKGRRCRRGRHRQWWGSLLEIGV
jgi:hypothetical protein